MQAGQIDKLGLWFPGDPIVNHDPDRSSSAVSDTGPENRLLSTANSQAQPPRSLPCVVQLGFVGARHLFDTSTLSAEEAEKLQAEALHLLRQTCIALRDDLKLEPHQFVAAISQLAIGADMLVAQVCQSFDQPIPHRVFLPQLTAAFLDASNENGTPDFLPAEKAIVVNLLKSPSIIQERVVSRSNSRSDRFRPPICSSIYWVSWQSCCRWWPSAGCRGPRRLIAKRGSKHSPRRATSCDASGRYWKWPTPRRNSSVCWSRPKWFCSVKSPIGIPAGPIRTSRETRLPTRCRSDL